MKIAILILLVTASFVFAPAQEKPKAYKFFEFGKISNSLMKEKVDEFYKKLKKDADSQGYIINYGTDKKIAKREKQLRDNMNFRDYDVPRITFVRGGNIGTLKSVFWIVPKDAKPPTP